jgi:hypothetical protein
VAIPIDQAMKLVARELAEEKPAAEEDAEVRHERE